MSLNAIVNLAERILNKSSKESGDTNVSSKQSKPVTGTNADSDSGDQFTPSIVNQPDAGLFQVTQFSLFSAAAEFLLSQPNPPAVPAGAALGTTASPANAVPVISTTQSATQTPGATADAALANTPNANFAPAATIPTPLPSSTTLAAGSSLSQLQSLNSALAALGLDPSALAQVDRIASLIQDFSPLAFTSLVYQLEALAKANTSQSVAAPTSPGTGTAAPAGNGNTSGVNTTGGFQVSELAIKFSGVQESIASRGANAQSGSPNIQLSALNLQVQEVNLTLTNQAGQSLQVIAPQVAVGVTSQTSVLPAPAVKAATA